MPIICEQLAKDNSLTGNADGNDSAELSYIVIGASDLAEAQAAVLDKIPRTYLGCPLENVSVDRQEGHVVYFRANYHAGMGGGGGGDEDDGEATESFDCGGGTMHMTHAIEQQCVYSADNTRQDDAGGMIGWNGKFGPEAEYAGVDVPCADIRQTYTKTISKDQIGSTAYKRTIASLVGKVNAGSFKGWQPGEVMFLGASFSAPFSGAKKVTVTYNFRIMPNENNCQVAGKSCGGKKGFEYLWVRSQTVNDTTTPRVRVKKIYKAKVCEDGDFSALGI